MSRKGMGKFAIGALIGAGLGVLFAPKKGSETRKDIKEKSEELMKKAKDIDLEEVKNNVETKIEQLKNEIKDLDKEKVLSIAKEKSEDIKNKIEELAKEAKDKATPVVESAIEELRQSAVKVTKKVLTKLENAEKIAK